MRVVVVGAGLSGLSAARSLTAHGHDVVVVDKGRSVGGRLATRRIGDARLDHGAQFFTVRDDTFAALVRKWMTDDIVAEWCRGFGENDGHPRYVGRNGMNSIAKHLAQGLDVRCDTLVFGVQQRRTGWTVVIDDSSTIDCDALVMTCPLPQTFSLLFTGGIEIPEQLRSTDYDRTIGLLAVLERESAIDHPGGLQNPDSTFSFVGDNMKKGISTVPAVTLHANPDWSLRHYDTPHDELQTLLTEAAAPYIGDASIVECQVKKWRFATPQRTWSDACWTHDSGTLVLAGDAFAGPKIEGATLSGLAAAEALLA